MRQSECAYGCEKAQQAAQYIQVYAAAQKMPIEFKELLSALPYPEVTEENDTLLSIGASSSPGSTNVAGDTTVTMVSSAGQGARLRKEAISEVDFNNWKDRWVFFYGSFPQVILTKGQLGIPSESPNGPLSRRFLIYDIFIIYRCIIYLTFPSMVEQNGHTYRASCADKYCLIISVFSRCRCHPGGVAAKRSALTVIVATRCVTWDAKPRVPRRAART
jgi:hypothetical protein